MNRYLKEFLENRTLNETKVSQELEGVSEFNALLESISGKIAILPDFDCDGIMAGTLAYLGLKQLGYDVVLHPTNPQRGYGMQDKDIAELYEAYPDLECIITCDQGISAYSALKKARELNLKIIVTDHHTQLEPIDCDVLVNPNAIGSTYPLQICGAHVIWKCLKEPENLAIFAAIATVSDMMPLQQDNRILVKEMDFSRSENIGIQSIYEFYHDALGYEMDEEFVGFYLAPLMNSAKRMNGDIKRCFDVFLSDNKEAATKALFELHDLNEKRKDDIKYYMERLDTRYAPYIYLSEAPLGLCGLMAAKLNDGKNPVLVINSDEMKGSGRCSCDYNCLAKLNGHGLNCAGHPHAFGAAIDDIEQAYNFMKQETYKPHEFVADSIVHAHELKFEDLYEFCEEIKKYKPFGIGFKKPIFEIVAAGIDSEMVKSHRKYLLGTNIEFMQWNDSSTKDILYGTPTINDFYKNNEKICFTPCN